MLYGLVIAIHIVVSLVLIAVILLQAGRGGGLSESFGSSTQTIFGSKTSVFLTRATTISAIVYILTCLTLAVMTGHRGRSLVAKGGLTMPAGQGQGQANFPQPMPDTSPLDY